MNLDHIVNTWAGISTWLFPVILLILGITLITRYRHTAGIALIVAAIAEFFHDYLFLYSDFTSGWETDCVTCVSYDYKPLGFLAANLLPAIWNVSIVIAFLLLIRSIFNKKTSG